MRILFIYTNINVRAGNFGESPAMQLGIASISSLLKKHGHETDLLLLTTTEYKDEVKRKISVFNPHIAAYTAVTTQFANTMDISKYIHTNHPDIFQVCGGPHTTLSKEKAIHSSFFDAICIGEGEHPMLELVTKIQNKKDFTSIPNLYFKTRDGGILKNEIRPFNQQLDLLPFVDRTLYKNYVNLPQYPHSILTTRGCYFNCSYCCNHIFKTITSGKYIRSRSIKNIIDEIECLQKCYPNLNYLYIEDETIGLDRNYWEQLLPLLKKTGLKYGTNYRIGVTNLDFITHLKESNFIKINIGVESGNEFIRKKVLKRNYTNDQIIETFSHSRKLGMITKAYNLIGLPYETPEKFNDTVNINRQIQADETMLNIFYPYPGTTLDKVCDEQGLKINDGDRDIRERTESILSLPDFPKDRIMYYFNNWNKLIKGSIYQRLNKLAKKQLFKYRVNCDG